jgi:hypothetical protein
MRAACLVQMGLNSQRPEPDELAYAAFYADCLHEMRPITAGHRLTLIYNLLRYGDGPMPGLTPQGEQNHQQRGPQKSAGEQKSGQLPAAGRAKAG